MSEGNAPKAIAAFRSYLKLDPGNEKATLGLARAYRAVYNYDEARRLLKADSARHPKSAPALVELGTLDIHLQHYDDAIAELQTAVRREPALAEARLNLGAAYAAKGDFAKAMEQFNQAIELDPRSAAAYYFRGLAYSDRDDDAHAYEDAKKASLLDPASEQSHILLAKVAIRLGKCPEAVDILNPLAASTDAKPENIYLLSRAYRCSNQPDLAARAQQQFEMRSTQEQKAKADKMEADHLATQAGEVIRQNQLAPAIDLLNQALAKDPQNGPAKALLAKIDFSRGDLGKAHEEISIALLGNPYNPDYLYVLGKILVRQNDLPGALQAFQRTVTVDPQESDAYYEISQIYLQMRDRKQAIEAIKEAIKLSPDDNDYRQALKQLLGSSPLR